MHKLISVSYLGMLLMTWIDHGAQLTMDYFRYSVSLFGNDLRDYVDHIYCLVGLIIR